MNRIIATLALAIVAALPASNTRANQIALGIDWRSGIFVQEYWQNDYPYYLIANTTDKPISIGIGTSGKQRELRAPVPVAAHAVAGTSAWAGNDMVTFTLGDGTDLGLMPGPGFMMPATAVATIPSDPNGPIITRTGLNDSGGRDPDMEVTQDHKMYVAGQAMEILLTISHLHGTLLLRQSPDPVNGLSHLIVSKIATSGLVVTRQANGDTMIAAPAGVDAAPMAYQITFTATAPRTTRPTFALLDIYYATGRDTGEAITRGIWVAPAAGGK